MHLNFEFKARTERLDELEAALQSKAPRLAGEDAQTDTYFHVPHGRLKLREGNIENALIHYVRHNVAGAKQSDVILYSHVPGAGLKAALSAALGVKVVVDKRRRIYFVGNVKIHFDRVAALGTFVEVEAIDSDGSVGIETLKRQCAEWAGFFGIREEDYMAESYSDLLIKAGEEKKGF